MAQRFRQERGVRHPHILGQARVMERFGAGRDGQGAAGMSGVQGAEDVRRARCADPFAAPDSVHSVGTLPKRR